MRNINLSFALGIIFIVSIHCKSIEIHNEEQTEEVDNYSPENDMDKVSNSMENSRAHLFIPVDPKMSSPEQQQIGGGVNELDPTSLAVNQWTSIPKIEMLHSPIPLSFGKGHGSREQGVQITETRVGPGRLWPPKASLRRKVRNNREKNKLQRLSRLSYYLGEPERQDKQILYRHCFFSPISCF